MAAGVVALLAIFPGCGEKKGRKTAGGKKGANNVSKADPHEHEHGPHGGHVIELGGEYHAELTHDDDTKTVSVYLLGGDVKKPVLSNEKELSVNLTVAGQPKQYKLVAAPQQGDPEGQSSRFELKDEALLEALEAPKAKGRLQVTIDGKQYNGAIESHEH
jgi:hypothetical protein